MVLETVKRGDDDESSSSSANAKLPKTVVLRIYESMGGHARATLRVAGSLGVAKAYAANLLEDELEELPIATMPRADADSDVDSEESQGVGAEEKRDIAILLHFRGFEVKTVKLVLGNLKTKAGGFPKAR